MRYLSSSFAVICIAACGSRPDQHATNERRPNSPATLTAPERSRSPCNGPGSCGDWLIHTAAYDRGDEPARFAASFRTVGHQVSLWLDTAFAWTDKHSRWTAADSMTTALRPHEILAQACGLTGSHLEGRIVALVQDTVTKDRYPTPRLAWRIDIDSRRIRPLAPDSVYCVQEFAGE